MVSKKNGAAFGGQGKWKTAQVRSKYWDFGRNAEISEVPRYFNETPKPELTAKIPGIHK
jgi:hypothetical protein